MSELGPTVEASDLTVIDLFSGAGGLSVGFEQAGFRVMAGTDYDPDAMATFARNFPNATAVTGDIREGAVKERVFAAGADVDVIVGGPPCQAFSQVRNHSRLIDDPRNSLYREFVQVVDFVEPKAFVMENVPGMDQMGVREQVQSDLALSGKYIVRPTLLDAADFGVPQTRKRLVFVGVHSDLGVVPPAIEGSGASAAIALMPDSTARRGYRLGLRNDVVAEDLLERLQNPGDTSVVSVQQAIGDLNFLEAGNQEGELHSRSLRRPSSAYQRLMRSNARPVTNLEVPRMNADTRLRLEGIPAGGNYRDLPDHLRRRYLTGQKWGPTNGSDMLSRKHYYAYRRLHPGLWAWTLNTKADAVYHYKSPRALSVREFCRLQSFPDSFEVVTDSRRGELQGRQPNGATHSRYRQIGNAVPPLLAAAVAGSVKQILANEKIPQPV
ncbi:DNA cytosine methyltransferase [Microbacterium sp. NEAU-LLC]|uniref:Cytosine-specific methyltransferase n=1 Tax=Microbacterium helvum TaxID=2773713 RepID=A0ABR8NUY0_9MICO|nr:DNA cytosine methyltransferase [Microbacterium helvum]MBD3943949.1 DNA cytosine methyltransferase [Microbacterium helvum]